MGAGAIVDSIVLEAAAYGINSSTQTQYFTEKRGFLAGRPLSYPAFAEYVEPAPACSGVSDTALTMRTFHPINPRASREAALRYAGPATLLDARVACVRPTFSNVQISALMFNLWISGLVGSNETGVRRFNSSAGMSGRIVPVHLNCTFLIKSIQAPSLPVAAAEWPISICDVPFGDSTTTGLVTEVRPDPPAPATAPRPGPMYLLINTTGPFSDWGPVKNAGGSLRIEDSSGDGEWTTLRTNVTGLTFGMTLCSLNPVVMDTNVTAARSSGGAEAEAGWSRARESLRDGRHPHAAVRHAGQQDANSRRARYLLPVMEGLVAGAADHRVHQRDIVAEHHVAHGAARHPARGVR